jgi:heme/copper-type cytochrome/quinol oxidase subunit 2
MEYTYLMDANTLANRTHDSNMITLVFMTLILCGFICGFTAIIMWFYRKNKK